LPVTDKLPDPQPSKSDSGVLRSPIRPQPPPDALPERRQPSLPNTQPLEALANPETAALALEILRRKMENVANEFADGKINRAQFNAIYGRYNEKRAIVERILERDPDSDAWQRVVRAGHTSFLRSHFAARCVYYVIFRLDWPRPLMMGGAQQPDMDQLVPVLSALNKMSERPRTGLARKHLGDNQWLVLALGEFTVTIAVYNLEPANAQLNRQRDLHNDFERANRKALERGTQTLERMVFPQRALVE
jgi:hypothetical protein